MSDFLIQLIDCPHCLRQFETTDALKTHTKAAHSYDAHLLAQRRYFRSRYRGVSEEILMLMMRRG